MKKKNDVMSICKIEKPREDDRKSEEIKATALMGILTVCFDYMGKELESHLCAYIAGAIIRESLEKDLDTRTKR